MSAKPIHLVLSLLLIGGLLSACGGGGTAAPAPAPGIETIIAQTFETMTAQASSAAAPPPDSTVASAGFAIPPASQPGDYKSPGSEGYPIAGERIILRRRNGYLLFFAAGFFPLLFTAFFPVAFLLFPFPFLLLTSSFSLFSSFPFAPNISSHFACTDSTPAPFKAP